MVRRGPPDRAARPDRRSPKLRETCGRVQWLGRETGHNLGRSETVPMNYLQEIDFKSPEFGDLYDELPLWSAPFGLLLLEHVKLRPGLTILDVGAGTGFMSIELALQSRRSGHSVISGKVRRWVCFAPPSLYSFGLRPRLEGR